MMNLRNCKSCLWNKKNECGRDFCMFPRCVMAGGRSQDPRVRSLLDDLSTEQ